MFNAVTKFFTQISRKYLPDAFIFALVLTLIIFIGGMVFQGETAINMISYWGNGFWNLLSFSMQMALILITGFTLAKTDLVSWSLNKIASLAKNQSYAVLIVTMVSIMACYLNWGFGLVVSALLAVEVAKKLKKVNFALLLASAYSGFLVWHGGLSGSIPLKLTAPSSQMQKILGRESIGLNETIFSLQSLLILFLTVTTLLVLNYFFSLQKDHITEFSYKTHKSSVDFASDDTLAKKLENSKLLLFLISLMSISFVVNHFYQGGGLNLNMMIFIFLFLAFTLSKTPKKFLSYFHDSVKDSSGILLQFPFYAGMMGMMTSSGLAQSMSRFFVEISSAETFLFFTYISAGIVNFFVPSGGGQWVVQGPIILPAAKELGIELSKASMAIAWGDAWSNMVQPFWALPLLSIGRISLGEMMGYCVMIFIATGVVASSIFLFVL